MHILHIHIDDTVLNSKLRLDPPSYEAATFPPFHHAQHCVVFSSLLPLSCSALRAVHKNNAQNTASPSGQPLKTSNIYWILSTVTMTWQISCSKLDDEIPAFYLSQLLLQPKLKRVFTHFLELFASQQKGVTERFYWHHTVAVSIERMLELVAFAKQENDGLRSYWASEFQPENYNFADYDVNEGYSIFYYYRLSLGKSQVSIYLFPLTWKFWANSCAASPATSSSFRYKAQSLQR